MGHGLRFALVTALGCLAGCGGSDAGPAPLPVYQVGGRVHVGGSPTANVQIAFHPMDQGAALIRPVGFTGADGTFRLTTYANGDGAPAGEYVVTVMWPNDSIPRDECGDPTAHDRLNGYYLDPATRRLLATIQPGPNAITLHVSPGSTGWALPRQRDRR